MCEHYETDVSSIEDIRRSIIENKLTDKLAAVTSLLDETLHHACEIAKELHIIGPDPALTALTDKSIVQSMIPEFSPHSLTFSTRTCVDSNIHAFFATHPEFENFLLKPSISSGGVGISIIDRTITVNEIKKLIRSSTLHDHEAQTWTIQPRLTGRLYSLEGFVHAGQPTFLGFSRRVRRELTEISTEFPVDNDLPYELQQKCKEAMQALVDRSQYSNGYFHCEFIIDAAQNSAYFIDGNMGRVAGAGIVPQIALNYHKNPLEIYTHVFDLGLFKGIHTEDFSYGMRDEERTLSINYCLAEPGVVLSISLPTGINSIHFQLADEGVYKPGVGKSDNAWIGFMIGFKSTVTMDITRIMIETDKGFTSPFYTFVEANSDTTAISPFADAV